MVENLIAISWTCSYFEYFLWYLSLYFFCINVVKIGIFFFVCYLINIHGKKTFLYWKLSFFELVVHCNPKSAHMCCSQSLGKYIIRSLPVAVIRLKKVWGVNYYKYVTMIKYLSYIYPVNQRLRRRDALLWMLGTKLFRCRLSIMHVCT